MSQRSNQEWIRDLSGVEGKASQLRAHKDLAKYLFVVVYNYLLDRRSEANPFALARLSSPDIVELAHDFVQETLEKLVTDDYALLDQYREEGRFTSYMAAIVRRAAARELRRAYWQRQVVLPQPSEGDAEDWHSAIEFQLGTEDLGPEKMAARKHVLEVLKRCLDQLPDRQRFAFVRRVAEGRDTALVAASLGVTENAAYVLISRARKRLATCLRAHGIDRHL